MITQGKLNDTWRGARFNLKWNGVWREENTTWVKINGEWHAYVPDGIIIMYDVSSLPDNGATLCDGNNGTPNLLEKFVVASGNNSQLLTIPTDNIPAVHYHSATTTGTNSVYGVPAYSVSADHPGGEVRVYHVATPRLHSHSGIGTFTTQSVSASNVYPEHTYVKPTLFGKTIEPGAILARANDPTVITKCMQFLCKYLYMRNAQGTGGYASHTHISKPISLTATTDFSTLYTNDYGDVIAGTFTLSHTHSVSSSITDPASHIPRTLATLYGNKATSRIYWDELPSGTVVFSVSTSLPKGWWNLGADGLPRLDGESSSETIHNHTIVPVTTGSRTATGTTYAYTVTTPHQYRIPGNHVHNFYASFNDDYSIMPPRIYLKALIKG